MDKTDCTFILRLRQYGMTLSKMISKTLPELSDLVGNLTEKETNILALRRIARDEKRAELLEIYHSEVSRRYEISISWLKKYARNCGYTVNEGMTINDIVDLLLDDTVEDDVPVITCDEDQQKCIDLWNRDTMYIMAGPGAGKTTTVSKLAMKISEERPSHRILICVFNVCAQDTLLYRLKSYGAKIIPKNKCNDETVSGICVLTFDKLAYQCGIAASSDPFEGFYEAAPIPIQLQDDYKSDSTYRTVMEMSATKLNQYHVKWDYVIVDEAQDVNMTHAAFVDHFKSRGARVVAAGDPRQELYNGAIWFSHLWSNAMPEDKFYLRFNHRSSPEIVKFINEFSKQNFPTLHYDQIAVRTDTGSVRILTYNLDHAGESDENDHTIRSIKAGMTKKLPESFLMSPGLGIKIGRYLARDISAYAISPITTDKYHLDIVTKQIRQSYYTYSNDGSTISEVKSDKNIKGKIIANSKKIKGTERDHVIVYGFERAYDFNLPLPDLIKHIFVAISRPRDHLILAMVEMSDPVTKLNGIQLSACCAKIIGLPITKLGISVFKPKSTSKPLEYYFNMICTGDENSEIRNVLSNHKFIRDNVNAPSIQITDNGDHDFIGVYVELLIANKLVNLSEMEIHYIDKLEKYPGIKADVYMTYTHDRKMMLKNIMTIDDNGINIYASKCLLDGFRTDERLSQCKNTVLKIAIMKWSLHINLLWTVSNRLDDDIYDDSVNNIVAYIKHTYGCKSVLYQKLMSYNPHAHRSENLCERISLTGIPDFIMDDYIVEIKYVNTITPVHLMQLVLYCQMSGMNGCIYNIKTGETIGYRFNSDLNIGNIVRAIGFSNMAKTMHKDNINRRRLSQMANTYIAFDIEHDNSIITEIGAVAFSTDGGILDVYHKINPGVGVSASSRKFIGRKFNVGSLTGLQITDATLASTIDMVTEFKKWITNTSPLAIILHYGGSERLLFDSSTRMLDVLDIYKSYSQSGGNSLGDAMAILMNKGCRENYEYKLHRAFDDALCTMAVFSCVVNFEGTL